MSIIHDALKKVAERRKRASKPETRVGQPQPQSQPQPQWQPQTQSQPQPGPGAEIKPKKPGLNKKILLVIFICLIASVTFSSFILTKIRLPVAEVGAILPKTEEVPPKEAREPILKQPVKQPVAPKKKDYRDLSLDGIMYGLGKPCAVINNRIVEEGEFVEGAKVIKISKKEVLMNFKGKKFVLYLK